MTSDDALFLYLGADEISSALVKRLNLVEGRSFSIILMTESNISRVLLQCLFIVGLRSTPTYKPLHILTKASHYGVIRDPRGNKVA